ncbi:MAG: PAS domain S-box protein, partial [Candidatus Eremiobacterota bacterium]
MNQELTVLIIDDCEDDAILLAREISRAGYKVYFEYVSSLTSLEKALESNRWNIIISDYSLPGFNGLAVLNMIKDRGYDIPFIMVSGTIGENLAVEIMKSGAHDYVMKDNLTRLVPAIKRELREAEIRREKKLAEEALRKSEERYRILFEHANEGILVLKKDKIIFANPKFLETTGYMEDISEKSFIEFIHKDDRDMVMNYHYRRLRGEKVPDNYTFRFYDGEGNTRHVQLSGAMINWDGEAAVLVFLNDITEKKKLEEELLKIEKLESLGLLAGGIAHDFNNILASVLASISIGKVMLENNEKDKLFELLANVEKASLRAKDLTYQLLTFAKGGMPVKKTGIISDVIKEAANFAVIGTKSTCEFYFPEDLWPVSIDEGQISQVIQNLVLNAEQSMNGGTISISGENTLIDEKNTFNLMAGKYVKISVHDHGCGIEEKYLQKIFDPYFTTKQKSSGLGLTISYSIIRNHSGHIVADSVPGKGTTVTFFLPVSEDVHIP